MSLETLASSADKALDFYGVLSGKRPQLYKTGIGPLDRILGGMAPGSCGVLGARQGLFKSSLALMACLESPEKCGILSLEDGPDVLGARILSYFSGVNSLRMRTGELVEGERAAIRRAREQIRELDDSMSIFYAIGGGREEIEAGVRGLGEAGCKVIWLDYLQKARGLFEDRRNEVSAFYTMFQRECSRYGAAGMAISQFSRQDTDREPQVYWLKESGDIENEARIILLGWETQGVPGGISVRLAKCTYGGQGAMWGYKRDFETGSLIETADPDSGF